MLKKKEFIWNTIGSILFSLFSAITLMSCTRINGVEIAGMFSICYATGCILNAIGDLGIRIVQVTDTKRNNKYADYFYSRVFAIVAMLVLGVIFIIFTNYNNEKLFILIVLIFIRVLDNFSETFQAEFQLCDRLDIAGKSLLYRNFMELSTFIVLDKFTQNIYISFGGMLIAGCLVLIFYEYRNLKKYENKNLEFNFKKIKCILKESIPLGLSTLLSMYVINAVKYGIERFNNNEIQTYFNILYMPTFVMNLVALLILKPFLKIFGEYWNNQEYSKLIKLTIMLNLGILGCAVVGEVVCYFIGIPILNNLFKVDLSKYSIHLLVMIFSGVLYAMSTIMFYLLGTIRKQKLTTIAYGVASLLAMGISYFFINEKDIMTGATISSFLIMLVLFLELTFAFIYSYKKCKK